MKPRKSEKRRSSLKVSPTALKNKNEKLLARWTDGLFYFVKVMKVSEANKTCSVEFEDRSTAQVLFKDLLEAHEDGDAECHTCGDAEPAQLNAMVTCSNCERIYHQHCHIPEVKDNELTQKFVCRICVFASCAQSGGAKTTGHLAEKYTLMKQSLPYELKTLTWDASHTSNVEQLFCYCGGPGCWYNKMLQCCRCKQWFHEACLQSLKEQLLVGDHFYVFACGGCNQGREFLLRMEMKWLDIVQVSLFHLTMALATRYVDVDDIVACVMNHNSSFKLKDILNGYHASWKVISERVQQVLNDNKTIFICAGELRKKNTLYGLRERSPRTPQSFSLPPAGERITKDSLLHARSASKKITFSPSKCPSPVSYITKGTKRSPSSGQRVGESKKVKVARVKSEHNYCTPLKCPDGQRVRMSESPSSSSSSNSLDSTDLSLYDTNNNSSPAKHSSLANSPSPPPLAIASSSSPSHKRREESQEPHREARDRSRSQSRQRSRSRSSARETNCDSSCKSSEKSNKKSKTTPKGMLSKTGSNIDGEMDSTSTDKIEGPGLDLTPSSITSSPGKGDVSNVSISGGDKETFWSLDMAIPPPASFTGADHPFLTEFEQENLRQRRQHFEEELSRLASAWAARSTKQFALEFETQERKLPLAHHDLKNASGFKGELQSLFKDQLNPTQHTGKTIVPATSCEDSSQAKPAGSGERSVATARRSLRAVHVEVGESTGGGINSCSSSDSGVVLSSCSSTSSCSPGASVVVNGVKISPTLLSSPSGSKSSNGRSGRSNRGASSDKGKVGGNQAKSPTAARRLHEEDTSEQRRATALQRCLKNLTPTCGFHFPVLEESHPAVTEDTWTSSRNDVQEAPASGPSTSSAPSPLQQVKLNGNSARGKKRRHSFQEEDDADSKNACRKRKDVSNQENVRRSHRSRSVVHRFQADLDGGGLMIGSAYSSQGAGVSLADQYEVLSLRVGLSGKVEYLIDWGQ